MNFGSLFAGIGGFDLGLERAGMKCSWQVEIDDYATRVLQKHWPQVKRFRDVRECGKNNLDPVDLICGGFPCQPFSFAGKRKGENDERNMWPETARILGELRPRFALLENVPGLVTHKYFGRVLGDLAEIGYDCEWDCIPASTFGAPHRRDRLWVIAYSNGERRRSEQISKQGSSHPAKSWNDVTEESLANPYCTEFKKQWKQKPITSQLSTIECDSWWASEPTICRMANGVPNRVDRLKCLGNAVVPQVVEWVGKGIKNYEQATETFRGRYSI